MSTSKFRHIMMSMMAAALLLSSFAGTVSAATDSAPAAQNLRAQEVTGTIPGGQFAEIWLGLESGIQNEAITLISTWDRLDPAGNGLGFYVLTDQNVSEVLSGVDPSQENLAAGSKLGPESPDNEIGAVFQATSDQFTLIVFNNSNDDANFKISAENAYITDGSGQVTAPSDETDMADSDDAADDTDAATEAPAATEVAEAAETEATPEPEATEEAKPDTVTTPGVIEGQDLAGELPDQFDQHFLGLEPSVKDGTIDLLYTFNPQDSSELARRTGFWVLDQDAFNRYLNPSEEVILSKVAIAAGSGDQPELQSNERTASFTASGMGPYTVVVYNNSTVPADYTLHADGGMLRDDSGQTTMASDSMDATKAMTDTIDSDESTEAAPATETDEADDAEPADDAPTREGEPGGSYTVESGDTLSLIARDIYGDVGLWEELCSFNNLDDCNALEVGDTLQLPTKDQLGTGATAPATSTTPAPAATTKTADETPSADETSSTDGDAKAEDTQATAETPEAATPVTSTTSVTTTTEVTSTDEMTDTTKTDDADSSGGTVDLITQLEAQGSFTTLVKALEEAGLSDALQGDGPFTIFAPTDAAFDALPAGAMEQLLSNPTGQLTQILLFHVLPGEVTGDDITDGMQATTQQGKPVNFEVTPDGIKVNGANITLPDTLAVNGVIHAIDAVILPPPD